MNTTSFQAYALPAPAYEDVAAEYQQITRSLDAAKSDGEAIAAIERWDVLRRRLYTWSALVYIRFHQDTRNDEYKQAREYRDELEPRLTNLAVDLKRRVMESRHRDAVAERFGAQAFALWKCDLASFDPAIEADLVQEAKLDAKYTELLASAKFHFHGESLTLSELRKYAEHPERGVRHDAARLRWGWFGEQQEQLDTIFDQLVRLRQQMAEKLGYENFIPLGYARMRRVDYDRHDVDRFRAQVRAHVVPLVAALRRRQAERLGVEQLMAWDEELLDPAGNARPQGDHDLLVERGRQMFAQLDTRMDACFAQMCARNLIDLKSREGKAGGGFCEILPDFGMPFIYANFNGTKGDVDVFTHEMGHAFQVYSSLHQPLVDYVWPTTEACEIHSMSLELLAWPQMELFFEGDAERYRQQHLTDRLMFLPYGVAVDHFQHLVYAEPHASAADRAAMWQEMERTYLPWVDWGDLAHPASGRRWHAQAHIFSSPFYYIDYTLALTCALQLWVRANDDRDAAMESYIELCRRGGEAPFGELVRSVGLVSPFDDGCLARAVEHARQRLATV